VARADSESQLRSEIRSSLLSWTACALHDAGQAPAAHQRLLIHELEAVSDGSVDRLLILMPPGSAKSTYASVLFPVWWFTQHPGSSIIAASHTAGLAQYFGRQVRRLVTQGQARLGYAITSTDRSNSHWFTSCGGEYYAVGIRGSVVGRRADLAIIDDPIKSQAEADNLALREHIWNWYRSDLTTRLKPQGRLILIMTRWHEDDLCGRLLGQAASEWRSLTLAAVAQPNDLIGRPIDAPLWPEWEDGRALQRKRATLGERAWSALFQQSPRTPAGTLFKVDKLRAVDLPPSMPPGRVVRAWDLAATAQTGTNDPDWTVGVKMMRDEVGRYTILDIIRLRGSPQEVEQSIVQAARADGRGVVIGLPEDPGQAGKGQVAYLTAQLAGYHVTASRETGPKMTRAAPVASQMEAGNMTIVRDHWNHAFIEELREFPSGRKDDQVDALSRALRMLTEVSAPTRRVDLLHLAR